MACNTCHPHPPMDWSDFSYDQLWVAVNTAFYEARKAIEKYTKAKGVDDGPPGTIPRLPEVVPTEDDGDGTKFIAEDGGFGFDFGAWEGLVGGNFQEGEQYYGARLGYEINDNCTLYLGYIRTGAGSNSDIFGLQNSGGSSMIPGAYHSGYWEQTGPGQSTYHEDYYDDAVREYHGTDTFYFTVSCSI